MAVRASTTGSIAIPNNNTNNKFCSTSLSGANSANSSFVNKQLLSFPNNLSFKKRYVTIFRCGLDCQRKSYNWFRPSGNIFILFNVSLLSPLFSLSV